MRVDWLIRELAGRGITVSIKEPGSLRIEGAPSPSDIEALKANKQDVIDYLRSSRSKLRNVDWDALRNLAPYLGKDVETGEPWGKGILWGLSPHGAAVMFEPCIVTFYLKDVKPYSR